jgi:putative phage-type endonuclease
MFELIDITDTIIPETEVQYFNEDEFLKLYETCLYLMEEFIQDYPSFVSEPDFEDMFDENIQELMHSQFEFDIFYTEDAEDEINNIIEHAKDEFFKHYMPPRSYSNTIILEDPHNNYITQQINVLRNKPQPIQRTKEWYEFRHNLITASNAYKAFENQTVKNQLIYEKCKPLNPTLYAEEIKEVIMVNTNTTLHWGQKYEPLSVKIYEHIYDTKIEDFGCIQHKHFLFIGASPDGINIDPNSKRYGRMLEIKNIVNRIIDGIPKKEYWIQMQLQMEVCELNECDFLETKFTEYPDYTSFLFDIQNNLSEDTNLCLSKDNCMKGLMIYFHTKEGKPFYVHKPLNIIHSNDITLWQENMVDYYQSTSEFNYTYIKTNYWKLEKLSCVLVCRNQQWFKDNVKDLENIWNIIKTERVTGYEHRQPNRKQKKTENTIDKPIEGCLLHFNKETGKINVIKKQSTSTENLDFNFDINFDNI